MDRHAAKNTSYLGVSFGEPAELVVFTSYIEWRAGHTYLLDHGLFVSKELKEAAAKIVRASGKTPIFADGFSVLSVDCRRTHRADRERVPRADGLDMMTMEELMATTRSTSHGIDAEKVRAQLDRYRSDRPGVLRVDVSTVAC